MSEINELRLRLAKLDAPVEAVVRRHRLCRRLRSRPRAGAVASRTARLTDAALRCHREC
jgi:hypothetical protein